MNATAASASGVLGIMTYCSPPIPRRVEPVNLGDVLKLRPLDRPRGSLAVCHEPFVCDGSGPWTLDAYAVLSGGSDESAPVQRAGQPPSEEDRRNADRGVDACQPWRAEPDQGARHGQQDPAKDPDVPDHPATKVCRLVDGHEAFDAFLSGDPEAQAVLVVHVVPRCVRPCADPQCWHTREQPVAAAGRPGPEERPSPGGVTLRRSAVLHNSGCSRGANPCRPRTGIPCGRPPGPGRAEREAGVGS